MHWVVESTNPYPSGSEDYEVWLAGYDVAFNAFKALHDDEDYRKLFREIWGIDLPLQIVADM
jgi:hypothetical protein